MRLLILLLLLAGCSSGDPGEPGSTRLRLNGTYTSFGGLVTTH